MAFYGKEITDDDLHHCAQFSTVIDKFDEFDEFDNMPESPDYTLESTSLKISSMANLDHDIFNNDQMVQPNNVNRENPPDNTNYNVNDLVLRFLDDEFVTGNNSAQ